MNELDFWRKPSNPLLDFNALADSFFRNDFALPFESRRSQIARCELSETPQAYQLRVELPGFKKEEIKIDLHDNRISVSGEHREERKEEKDRKVHYSELSQGPFSRNYTFPTPVDAEKAEANFENGILQVKVAKANAAKAKQIAIH